MSFSLITLVLSINVKFTSVWICKKAPPGFFSNCLVWGLFSNWPSFVLCFSTKKLKTNTCVFNAFYIFSHANPAPSPLPITSHNSLRGIQHYYISEIRARGRSLQQSFPEGIIKPYELRRNKCHNWQSLPLSNLLPYFVSLWLNGWNTDFGHHIASFDVGGDESLASKSSF